MFNSKFNFMDTQIAREGFARTKYAIRQRIKKYEHLAEIAVELGDDAYLKSLNDSIITCKRILDDVIGIEVACLINFQQYEDFNREGK